MRLPKWAHTGTPLMALSALCHLVSYVIIICSEKEMFGPDAKFHVTAVKDMQTFGDRAKVDFPTETMGAHVRQMSAASFACANRAIAVIGCACPQPTGVSLLDIRPESHFERQPCAVAAMALNELRGLSFDVAAAPTALCGNWRRLTTPTSANARRIGNGPIWLENLVVVTTKVAQRLTFDPAFGLVADWCKRGHSAAAAGACAKFMLRCFRDILTGHQKLTFLASNLGALWRRCPVFLLCFTRSIIPQDDKGDKSALETFSQAHKTLQMFCAEFWSSAVDCEFILADIGVDSKRINLAEPSIMRWLSIIRELMRMNDGSMGRLVSALMKQYPENQSLRAVCAPWVPAAPAKTEVLPSEVVPVVAAVDFATDVALVVPRVDTLWETLVDMERRLLELEQWRNQSR